MKYNHPKIESKWQKEWLKEKIYEPNLKSSKNPFYNLMMFPYPSAEGLHVGNMYAFTGSDIYGRFKRMQGHDVFEPIGLDGFGIHSENYALKIGKHPADQAKISEKNFYRQLEMIGNGFAWNERLETYDPEYYHWTQWIFIQLYKNGLAYRKKSAVNWCPSCLTVLADEQVIGGKCERCVTKVIKKDLEQWFFRITKYADKLLKGLGPVRSSLAEVQRTRDGIASETSNGVDWSEKVKIAQRNWIGKSEGAMIKFSVVIPAKAGIQAEESGSRIPPSLKLWRASKSGMTEIEVFTTRPDTLFGATYMVVSPEHEIVSNLKNQISNLDEVLKYSNEVKKKDQDERIENKEKTGIEIKGIKAINPANSAEIPIFVSDYVLSGYGTGAVMSVPAHDERDFEFAKKFKLEVIRVIEGGELPYVGDGKLVNSGKFNGIDSEKAKWEITKFVGGEKKIQCRLRDWLISRQRYWGPPIPMIYCPSCAKSSEGKENPGWFAVAEKDLPVKLPYIKEFRPTGSDKSPLSSDEKFYKTKCPKCGGCAKRETDVSDTFLDSAWYYIGYLAKSQKSNLKSQTSPFENQLIKKWCPVDMYIGGAEHSVLHLLYVRFLAMVFKDLGFIDFDEPFKKFRAHGLLIKDGAKMSKSKGNVINPDNYIKQYGADALRMYLMFLGPFDQGGDFRDSGIKGITRFLERVWKLSQKSNIKNQISKIKIKNQNLYKNLHKTIKKITEDIEGLSYNTAISALMILLNDFESDINSVGRKEMVTFLKLLAPFAPHMSEEIWRSVLKNKKSIHISEWPKYNPELIKESEADIIVQINGKMRAVVKVRIDSDQSEVERIVKSDENVKKYLTGQIKKVVFVKDKLINFVI